jgi:hypothetical protein
LPDTTQAALIVADVSDCVNAFKVTDLGLLFDNPEIGAYVDDLREQLEKKATAKGLQLGMRSHEAMNIISGEMSIAMLRMNERESAVCYLADVSEDIEGAQQLLTDSRKRLHEFTVENKKEGGNVAEEFKVGEAAVTGIVLPRDKGELETIVYSTIVNGWLVAADHREAITQLVKSVQGTSKQKNLSEDPVYLEIMKRASPDVDMKNQYIKWFVKPFGFAKAIQARTLREVGQVDYIAALKKHGYDAIKGAGGFVAIRTEELDMLSRAFVYAPPQEAGTRFVGAAQALDFANNGEINMLPEFWIPESASSHLSLVWNLPKAFEKTVPMIEQEFVAGQGDAIHQALDGVKKDPKGPMVDIEQDIVAQLGKKITIASDLVIPLQADSERLLMTVKIDGDVARFRSAMDKLVEFEAKNGGIEKISYKGFTLWKLLPEEIKVKHHESIEIETGDPDDIPGLCGGDFDDSDAEKKLADEEKKEVKAKKNEPLLKGPLVPTQVFLVAHDHLIVTNNVEFAKELLDVLEKGTGVGMDTQKDFQKVNRLLDSFTEKADSMRRFVRLSKAYRLTYSLIRSGTLPQSKSLLGSVLNAILESEEGVVRKPTSKGELLPADYDADVAPFLGNMGWSVKTEDDGWIITGVLVSTREED